MKEFDRRTTSDGKPEDAYEWLSRQITMARTQELVWLFMLRSSDANQQRAMELAVQAKVVFWTRFATIAALATSTGAVIVAIVAIVAKT